MIADSDVPHDQLSADQDGVSVTVTWSSSGPLEMEDFATALRGMETVWQAVRKSMVGASSVGRRLMAGSLIYQPTDLTEEQWSALELAVRHRSYDAQHEIAVE